MKTKELYLMQTKIINSITNKSTFSLAASCLAIAALSSAVGCGSQNDSDYPGSPLMTLEGVVNNELPVTPDSEVRVVWVGDTTEQAPTAEAVEVSGQFPSAFTFSLYAPPDLQDINVAIGFIVAVESDLPGSDAPSMNNLIGVSETHIVLYLPKSTQNMPEEAASIIRTYMGGDFEAGIYLMKVNPNTSEEDGFDTFTRVDSANSSIDVTLDAPENLRFPKVF